MFKPKSQETLNNCTDKKKDVHNSESEIQTGAIQMFLRIQKNST